MSSWRASAIFIASGCSAHSLVDPSRSVKRKVTVPVGSSDIGALRAQFIEETAQPLDHFVVRHGGTAGGQVVEALPAERILCVLGGLGPAARRLVARDASLEWPDLSDAE